MNVQQIYNMYPNAVKHELPNGELLFTVEMTIGGVDSVGPYLLVLDGPAVGEKCYD